MSFSEQTFWSVALSQSHDNESRTFASSVIYNSRNTAVQGLWEMIVDKKFYHPSVIVMWEHLFDYNNYSDTLDNDDVYDESSEYYLSDDSKLIRKLITPEMNSRIKEFVRFHDKEKINIDQEQTQNYLGYSAKRYEKML